MALANVTDLQSAVSSWANNANLTAQFNDFLLLAESLINRGFQVPGNQYVQGLRTRHQETTATLSISANSANLPSGFLEAISLAYTDGDYPLKPVSKGEIDALRALNTTSGRPERYCIGATAVLFDRTPDTTYQATLRYYEAWDLAADSTNWLLTNRPDIYLHACLVQAARYLKDWNEADLWLASLASEMNALQLSESRSEASPTLAVDAGLVSRGIFDINTGR